MFSPVLYCLQVIYWPSEVDSIQNYGSVEVTLLNSHKSNTSNTIIYRDLMIKHKKQVCEKIELEQIRNICGWILHSFIIQKQICLNIVQTLSPIITGGVTVISTELTVWICNGLNSSNKRFSAEIYFNLTIVWQYMLLWII